MREKRGGSFSIAPISASKISETWKLESIIFAPGINTRSLGAGQISVTSRIGIAGVQVSVTGTLSLRLLFYAEASTPDPEEASMVFLLFGAWEEVLAFSFPLDGCCGLD